MKLLYHGRLWSGSTARQRLDAFQRQAGVNAIASDVDAVPDQTLDLYARARWKLRWPIDLHNENPRLIEDVATTRPDVVFVDNSRVISCKTLRAMREICDPLLVYYSPDDAVAPHNLTWPVRMTFPEWDVVFTTKTFNISELRQRGVRNPVLIGNAFDPLSHRPMTREEVGDDFERFDLVFMGTVEGARARSILRLADAGFKIAVYGNPASRRGQTWHQLTHANIVAGPPAYGVNYARQMHHGKVALCFLRKMNRDLITTRSIEIPGMARAMIAEKTPEHDAHFVDGVEYVGFQSDDELVSAAAKLIADADLRSSMAKRGYQRCLSSSYSTDDRAREMMETIFQARTASGGK